MTSSRVVPLMVLLAACGGASSGTPDGAIDAVVIDDASGGLDAGSDAQIDAVQADAMLTTLSVWDGVDGLPEASCVPWTLLDTADPEAPVLAAGVLTLADDVDAEVLAYAHGPDVLAMPEELVIEAQVRYGSGSAQGDSRSGAYVGFTLDDDRKNSLYIDDGVVFILTAENTRGPSYSGPTTDAQHRYRIEANTTTGAIEVFRDDVSIIVGTTFASPYPVDEGISWGEGSIVARGTADWTTVSHNALVPVACP